MAKRLPKKEAVSSLMANYGILNAGIAGLGEPEVAQIIKNSEQYLYQNEVETVCLQAIEKDEDFNAEQFVSVLEQAGAIKKSGSSTSGRSGESLTRIDSEERALQVANDPADAPRIQEIMGKIVALRDEIKPLISDHASVSVALKNKKTVEAGEVIRENPNVPDTQFSAESFEDAVENADFE